MIKIKNLTKMFGDFTAVDNLTLSVEKGEWFIFLGPNGAGKTTTIKMLMGLLVPTKGSAKIDGLHIIRDRKKLKNILGYISEEPYIYEYLKGVEYLEFVADLYSIPEKEKKERIGKLLDLFDFFEESEMHLKDYSMGMIKKVCFCAALINNPKVLFLDEPTSGLDPKTTNMMRNFLRELCNNGTTIFMSTHILGITEKLCDKIGIINKGKLIEFTTLDEISESYPNMSLEEICIELTGKIQEDKIGKFLSTVRDSKIID